MTSLETSSLHQKAVLWEYSGLDRYGDVTVSSPSEIDVRWEKSVAENTGPETSAETSTIEVVVDQDIAIGSILRLGTLSSISDLEDSEIDELYQVVDNTKIPDIKGRSFYRSVTLNRRSNSLPTVT